MIVTGQQQQFVPGYINYDDLVEGALEGVAEHRQMTRSRHLSSGNDDIASSYFAAQYGGQNQQPQQQKQSNSRRNSLNMMANGGGGGQVNSGQVASAAAKMAAQKQVERDEAAAAAAVKKRSMAASATESSRQQMTTERLEIVETSNNISSSQMTNNSYSASDMSGYVNGSMPPRPTAAATDSQRASGQFRYMDLLPPDGSFPHRTQPVGEPPVASRNFFPKFKKSKLLMEQCQIFLISPFCER